jgi:hypothetical protein
MNLVALAVKTFSRIGERTTSAAAEAVHSPMTADIAKSSLFIVS